MSITVGPPGAISHQAWYCPVYKTQLESVPICSTVLLLLPSMPTQVADEEPASPPPHTEPQLAVGTVHDPETAV
jgi:hypothetical protein